MSFNPGKCVVMRMTHKRNKPIQTSYHLHGQPLNIVNGSRYLVVTITDDLDWDTHICNTVNKGNRTVGFLRRSLRECTPKVKDAAYKAIARPTLEYATTVWDPALKSAKNDLEQVQRRAARFVANDYKSKTPGCVTKMIEDLQWETLENRRLNNRLNMMYKIHHGLIDIPAAKYMSPSDSRTRGGNRYFQERHTNQMYLNTFFPRTIKDWNRLPTNITSALNMDDFQSLLRASQ